jgi:hypothetical protein
MEIIETGLGEWFRWQYCWKPCLAQFVEGRRFQITYAQELEPSELFDYDSSAVNQG